MLAHPIPGGKPAGRIEMGGQALIEGVMMRSRTGYAAAVRRVDDGAIVVRQVPWRSFGQRHGWAKLPVVRGAVSLVEMMTIGMRTLHWSGEEYEAGLRRKDTGAQAEREKEGGDGALGKAAGAAMVAVSLALVILMVVVAPNLLAWLVGKLPPVDAWARAGGTMGFAEENHPIAYNLVSGFFRALILFLYVYAISLNEDIRRVFRYHGAEHKAVLAYEEGGDVTIERAQAHDTLHPRCGTTFLAVVVFVSIVVFALIAAMLVGFVAGFPEWSFWQRKLLTFGLHIAALPLVAGIAYELMKFCARHARHPLCAALLWPGYKFQRLTTRPPDDSMVEVAIVAMLAALAIAPEDREPQTHVVRGLQEPADGAESAISPQEATG